MGHGYWCCGCAVCQFVSFSLKPAPCLLVINKSDFYSGGNRKRIIREDGLRHLRASAYRPGFQDRYLPDCALSTHPQESISLTDPWV